MILIKKLSGSFLLGLAVIGMAIASEELKTASQADQYEFIRVKGLDNSTNPADYEFHPTNECDETTQSKNCIAEWLEATPPSVGDNPTGTMVPNTLKKGERVIN